MLGWSAGTPGVGHLGFPVCPMDTGPSASGSVVLAQGVSVAVGPMAH